MAVLFFHDEEAARRVLESCALPDSLTGKPARFAVDDNGRLWVQPDVPMSRAAVNSLSKLGVRVLAQADIPLDGEVACWHQLVALRFHDDRAPSTTTVLFEVLDNGELPELAAELQRLHPGRTKWTNDESAALVKVEHAPYYSLLRGTGAFVEQFPRVWVQFGYRYPLSKAPTPARGSVALLRAPRDWRTVPYSVDDSARDDIELPVGSVSANDVKARPVVHITPRLKPSTGADAELWLLETQAIARLQEWLGRSDDRLATRLIAAEIETENGRTIALLARPGSVMPASLGLEATGYRSYLKLPNLFLPVGTKLQPNMRRDAARRHFAPDKHRIVWLADDDNGGVKSASAPISAFRPLSDWARYTVPAAVQVSVEPRVAMLPLESFAASEKPTPTSRRDGVKTVVLSRPEDDVQRPGLLQVIFGWAKGAWQLTTASGPLRTETEAPGIPDPALELVAPPTAIDRIHAPHIESHIANMVREGRVIDAPQWQELAMAYAAAGRGGEAATAWLQALWSQSNPSVEAAWGWLRAEAAGAQGLGTPDDFTRWITSEVTPAIVRAVAAFAVRGSVEPHVPPALARTLGATQELLERHENWLPVRAVWLARRAIMRLCGDDSLSLARTRDRLFDRLFEHGLRVDQDVPAFLRVASPGEGERLPVVREWLLRTHDAAQRWVGSRTGLTTERHLASDRLERFGMARERQHTPAYVDFLWAWGLARLGDERPVHQLVRSAREALPVDEPVHAWLADAFEHRISQGPTGRPAGTPWPPELLLRLSRLSMEERYAIQRLRQHVRVLEPVVRIDAFQIARKNTAEASSSLSEVTDREELVRRVEELVRKARPNATGRAQVIVPLLDYAAFGGESLARSLLDQLTADFEPLLGDAGIANAMARAFELAAAMQLADQAHRLVTLAHTLIRRRSATTAESATLFASAVRALRILNLRDDLSTFLPAASTAFDKLANVDTQRCELAIASGWLALGDVERAGSALDDTRHILFSPAIEDANAARARLELAFAYIASLAAASTRLALGRYEEILQRLPVPEDSFVTNAYFALTPLRVLEAIVRSLVDDQPTTNPVLTRWLDEDELRVRRRIREDLDAALGAGP